MSTEPSVERPSMKICWMVTARCIATLSRQDSKCSTRLNTAVMIDNWGLGPVLLFTDEPRARLPCQTGSRIGVDAGKRSEEHTSELQSLMRISYAVFCLKKKKKLYIKNKHMKDKL